jgi:hypothetical protein
LSGQSIWLNYSQEIQQRLLLEDSPLLQVQSARVLYQQFSKALTQANNEGFLATKLAEIPKLLRLSPQNQKQSVILGGLEKEGTKNFKRSKSIPHFCKVDGSWFDFSVIVDETKKPAEIIGFDFELRFPEEISVQFIRFDLNLPGHDNQSDGLRFHLHPGSDDFMVHGLPITPLEILHLFLYGFAMPKKMRHSNARESPP